MTTSNELRYLRSLGAELAAQATRVRDLIGDAHWLSDGMHKESLLRALIDKHLPSGLRCFRGFVVTGDGYVSKEQDILVVDIATSAPLFHAADLAICFPEMIAAAISVKTKMARDEIFDAVEGLSTVHAVCPNAWTAGFFFDDEAALPGHETLYSAIGDALQAHQPAIRPIASGTGVTGPDFLCTMKSIAFAPDYKDTSWRVRGFDCETSAAAMFIARLLSHITHSKDSSYTRLSRMLDMVPTKQLNPSERSGALIPPGGSQ